MSLDKVWKNKIPEVESLNRSRPTVIDGWVSLHPTHLPPFASVIPDGTVTSTQAVFSSSLFPRDGHTVSHPTTDGNLYIFGGRTLSDSYLNDLWLYSMKDNTATLIQCYGDFPSPRAFSSISVVGNDLILWGGRGIKTNGDCYDNALYSLDLVSHRWTKITVHGTAPAKRQDHAFVTVGSVFFIFGGSYHAEARWNYLGDIWSFDLNTLQSQPTWKCIEPSSPVRPPPRSGHQWLSYQGQLITFGGYGSQHFNDVWSFDLETSKWTELQYTGQSPVGRKYYAATIIDDAIYIFGGSDDEILGDIAVFNISMRRWFKFETTGPSARDNHRMVSVGSLICVLGGWSEVSEDDLDIAYILDTESIEKLSPGSLATLVEREKVEKQKWRGLWEKHERKTRPQERSGPEERSESSESGGHQEESGWVLADSSSTASQRSPED